MTRHGLNEQDARALTYLTKRLRDETHGANTWDEAGIFAVVKGFIGRNLADTIERVTRHAADTEAQTPGAITRPFLPEPVKPTSGPPKRDQECPHHAGQWAGNCGGCRADQAAGDPLPAKRTTRTGVPDWFHEQRKAKR